MTSNKITYVVNIDGQRKEVTFTDRDIEMGSGKIFESNAMVAETLEADTIDFTINTAPARSKFYKLMDVDAVNLLDVNGIQLLALDSLRDVDPADFVYGEVIRYYRDGVLDGKFYARQARQVGKYSYHVEGISAVGLLIRRTHNGGMYYMSRVGDIIAEIMGVIPYTIDNDVADLLVSGWLPAQSARDNLQQVLFSCGASIAKDANRDLHIMFLGSSNVNSIPNSRIYNDGAVNYRNQVTGIDITEHAFYALASDPTTVLFDNTGGGASADHFKVVFDEPIHDLAGSGITIHESNCNYAIISGTGVLSGQMYTHTQRVLHVETGQRADENNMAVSDAYMVNAINSSNVAERVARYYGRIHEASIGVIAGDDVRPAEKIQFRNPFGAVSVGYVRSSEKVMSGVVRANLAVVTDWEPGPFGSNFEHWKLIKTSGSWTVPAGVTRVRAHLIGGGKGGWSGENGTAGDNGIISQDRSLIAANGDYGDPGEPGEGGRVLIIDLDVTPEDIIPITVGDGGDGGAVHTSSRESTEGSLGTATTMLGHSSDEGVVSSSGLVNLFSGEVYALPGDLGIRGAGGTEDTLTYKGVTYQAYGPGGSSEVYREYGAWGGISGRPAAGTRGTQGGNYRFFDYTAYGGNGGGGGDAEAPDPSNKVGGGGNGGNGGGGGGGGGNAYLSPYHTSRVSAVAAGNGGRGGYGSEGGKGGPGGVLLYW